MYKTNLEVLEKYNPNLAELIEEAEKPDWVDHIKSKKIDNIQFKENGKVSTMYDPNSPKKNIKDLISQMSFYKEDAIVVIGAGLGYLLEAILKRKEKNHRIILVEPTLYFIKQLLTNIDVSKYIEENTLQIVHTKEDAINMIHLYDSAFVVQNWAILSESYIMQRPNEYSSLIIDLSDIINQLRCNTGTVMGAGKEIAYNDIKNLPYLIKYRGVGELKDLYKNKPAITVNTGPSLKKNIHYLLEVERDNVIIIAVAQALRILLGYGIKPDFICTVDYGKVNYSHFAGLMNSDVPLVALNRTYAPILKEWQGPKFIMATPNPGFEDTAIGILDKKGTLDQGGSVSHSCLSLAVLLGCSPITIIGQDLALTDSLSHFQQADTAGEIYVDENGMIQWEVKDPNSHLSKTKNSMGPAHKVPGYFGDFVITNLGLASFITAFDRMIARYKEANDKIMIMNSTEGGAKIPGTIQITFKDFLDKYCTQAIDRSKADKYLTLADDWDELVQKVIPLLENDLGLLNQLDEECTIALKTSKEMEKIDKKSLKELEKLFEENTKEYKENKKKEINRIENKIKDAKIQADSNSVVASREATFHLLELKELLEKEKKKLLKILRMQKNPDKYKSKIKEFLLKQLLAENEKHSDNAHDVAKKLPLVGVAIFHASRQIHNRDLNVKGKVNHLLKNKNDLQTRIKRNKLILTTAKDTAKELKEIYKETLVFTEELSMPSFSPTNNQPTSYDFGKMNDYFKASNWAYPLLYAKKCKEDPNVKMTDKRRAVSIYTKAVKMRDETITEAKKNANNEEIRNILQYNSLIEEARKLGREKQEYKKACNLLKKAVKIFPDKIESLWGLSTALHHIGETEESIKYYKRLVTKYPDNHRFRFEYGQVLLHVNFAKGTYQIKRAMENTNEFDSFFARIGELYQQCKQYNEAIDAYREYLDKFPSDYEIWKKKGDCHKQLKNEKEADKCYKKVISLKPGYIAQTLK